MKKRKLIIWLISSLLILAMLLVACGGNDNDVSTGTDVDNGSDDSGSDDNESDDNRSEDNDDPGPEPEVEGYTQADLKELYEELQAEHTAGNLQGLTIEEVEEKYFDGNKGELRDEGETISFYVWRSADQISYVEVTFTDSDGEDVRTAAGVGSYLPE